MCAANRVEEDVPLPEDRGSRINHYRALACLWTPRGLYGSLFGVLTTTDVLRLRNGPFRLWNRCQGNCRRCTVAVFK